MPFFSSTFSPASSLRAGIQPEHDSHKLKWLKTTAAIRKLLGTFTWVLTPVCWSFACNSCKPRHSSFSAILIYFVSQLDMLIQFPAVEGFWFQDKSKKNLNRGSNSYRSRNSWLLDSAFSSGTEGRACQPSPVGQTGCPRDTSGTRVCCAVKRQQNQQDNPCLQHQSAIPWLGRKLPKKSY